MFGHKTRLIALLRAQLDERRKRFQYLETLLREAWSRERVARRAHEALKESCATRYARLAHDYLTWRWRAREREKVLRSVESYLLEQAAAKKGNAGLLERVRAALLLGLVVAFVGCGGGAHARRWVTTWCSGRDRVTDVRDESGIILRDVEIEGCRPVGQEV